MPGVGNFLWNCGVKSWLIVIFSFSGANLPAVEDVTLLHIVPWLPQLSACRVLLVGGCPNNKGKTRKELKKQTYTSSGTGRQLRLQASQNKTNPCMLHGAPVLSLPTTITTTTNTLESSHMSLSPTSLPCGSCFESGPTCGRMISALGVSFVFLGWMAQKPWPVHFLSVWILLTFLASALLLSP